MIFEFANAREILTWYRDAGIDVALLDEPVNRFEESALKASSTKSVLQETKPSQSTLQPRRPNVPARTAQATVPDHGTVERATTLAENCKSLDELREAIEQFDGCNLKFSARTTVFCDGNPDSEIMLVGEAPGRDEDAQGLPFVGRSGQLLDKMLAAIGLDRQSVYISNLLPWRPPGNRTPTPAEAEICRPFIERHIELAAPEILILVGGAPSKALLNEKNGIMSLRGKWRSLSFGNRDIPVMPMLHPAYLLRTPGHKRLAWNDLLAVKTKIQQIGQSAV